MKRRTWIYIGGAFVVVGVAAAIIGPIPQPAENVAVPASSPPAAHATFRPMPGTGNFAMIIPPGMAPDRMPLAAKEHCGAIAHCSVYGWTDELSVARSLPMSDRELATRAFAYDLNRDSGLERWTWDCRRYPRRNRDECL